mmetsp:Transcript_12150/g.31504  ORF Transcript_12150/g.31504 Transcript_12150/m.31504 type:complete len:207 (+) Transcript_12150:502-1122(+)
MVCLWAGIGHAQPLRRRSDRPQDCRGCTQRQPACDWILLVHLHRRWLRWPVPHEWVLPGGHGLRVLSRIVAVVPARHVLQVQRHCFPWVRWRESGLPRVRGHDGPVALRQVRAAVGTVSYCVDLLDKGWPCNTIRLRPRTGFRSSPQVLDTALDKSLSGGGAFVRASGGSAPANLRLDRVYLAKEVAVKDGCTRADGDCSAGGAYI